MSKKNSHKVSIVMGSQSDFKVMKICQKILKKLKIKCETKIISAHRTPYRMYEYAKNSGWSIISIKYHGMAIILIPWANPEMILDKKSNVIACLFFIPANLRLLTRLCTFDI